MRSASNLVGNYSSGFCDSVLTPKEVYNAIKASVKLNMAYIDRVVIVCSGRIEKGHEDAIKQFMKWLSHSSYKKNFVLVYGKADTLSEQQKIENCKAMCDKFQIPMMNDTIYYDENRQKHAVKMNLPLGFPPNANYADVEDDHKALLLALTAPSMTQAKRIPVDKSSCTIL